MLTFGSRGKEPNQSEKNHNAFFECVMLSGVSKLVGGKQGVRIESIMTSAWFWIVQGAALLARLAQSFSIFPGSPQQFVEG